MKAILLLLAYISITSMNPDPIKIFNLAENSALEDWYILDDGVMGGLSKGALQYHEDGYLIYSGEVSLDNNGGFSSIRYDLDPMDVNEYSHCTIKVKGDGKRYQLRLKSNDSQALSYVTYFETSGKWETIHIQLDSLYPTYRGRRLDMPNYPGELLSNISFLISNKKAEDFRLEIEWMELR